MTADVFHALTGEPHPSAPKAKKNTAAIAERLRKQRERLAARSNTTPDP